MSSARLHSSVLFKLNVIGPWENRTTIKNETLTDVTSGFLVSRLNCRSLQ